MSVTTPTVAAVKAIIATGTMTDDEVQAFIDDAALVAEGVPGVVALGATRQAAVVKWMTAHLISQKDGKGGQLTAKSLGDASESYTSPSSASAIFLQSTRYGQQACMLDTSGQLADLGKRKPSLVNW